MKVIEFGDITDEVWDEYVKKIPESTYLHSSWFINYQNAINGKENSKSFILMEDNEPVAICPLAIYKCDDFGQQYMEATFKGAPCAYPAIASLPSTQRRRTVRRVFDLIHTILKQYNIKRAEFYRHPMNLGFLAGNPNIANTAEAISFGYICHVKNTIIVDLRKEESGLISEMSKYQRKHIRKSEKQGLVINQFRGDGKDLDKVFGDFQSAHLKSAGRLTRPQESWDVMKKLLEQNKAALFIASTIHGIDISYLYCGEFDKFSFGWSQVNIDEYEKEYSPRHLLEWQAMLSFKGRGFSYYELGIKHDSPQVRHVPTRKEVTISQFKERYGGVLYCSFYFEKFFDRDLFNTVYSSRLQGYSAAEKFSYDLGDFFDEEGETK